MESHEQEQLTAANFQYSVSQESLLVTIGRFNGETWQFVRNAKRPHAINICKLEQDLGNNELLVFPLRLVLTQVWELLHRLAEKELTENN